MRRAVQALAISLGTITASILGTTAAHAASDLTPDPTGYCATNLPFAQQQQVAGWKVFSTGLIGDAGQNDWACAYQVWVNIPTFTSTGIISSPTGIERNLGSFPVNTRIPMDWAAMCNQQFPGASAQWIPGPATGVMGAPWQCVGPAGVTYDLAERPDGTHAVLNG
jgi:hypothetical protein